MSGSKFFYTFNGVDRASDGLLYERECYPWEYEKHARDLDRMALHSYLEPEWHHKQAKIFRERAELIRQQWAKQQAEQQAKQEAAKKRAEQQQAEFEALLQATRKLFIELRHAVTKQAAEQQAT